MPAHNFPWNREPYGTGSFMEPERLDWNDGTQVTRADFPPAVARLAAVMPMDRLRAFQADALRAFFATLEQMTEALARDVLDRPMASGEQAMGGAALARASRRVSLDAKERREFASMLLIGALLNRENPDWNPADPCTDRANFDDPLVTLLRMDPGPG